MACMKISCGFLLFLYAPGRASKSLKTRPGAGYRFGPKKAIKPTVAVSCDVLVS
jgi:hypothetical protein